MSGDWEFDVDDITAMRAEAGGAGLKAFMRMQIAAGKARREKPPAAAPPRPPGHRPGAWPAGSRPPGPPPERQIPAHVWDTAARHYSNEEHRPHLPCDCGNCPPKETR